MRFSDANHDPQNPIIRRILIVGGGTAGWLTASYLDRALNRHTHCCDLTLIESNVIGTVGVGEATIPTIVKTLRFLGVDEHEFLRECKATFKLAIRFEGWIRSGASDAFWHPFGC